MREIKFRGRERVSNKWVFGYVRHWKCCYGDEWHIQGENDNVHIVISETIGQYTGLRDANGQEIFEGDILSNGRDTVVVSYSIEFAAFVGLYNGREDLVLNLDDCIDQPLDELKLKVVGNVYDNPNLLEVTHD